MVELRHLSYFRAVAELGSIAKAAVALHMTQPTLSRQIAQLEHELGYQLLQRTSRGTTLTPAGRGLREQVGAVLAQVDRIPEVLRAAASEQRLVQMGIPPGLPGEWFRRFREALAAAHPEIKVSLHEATSEEQRRLLQSGLIDLGLVHTDPPELHSTLLFTHSLGCALRPPSELSTRRSITFGDLDGLRVMAHSADESPEEEVRLRAGADVRGVDIDWVFRRFSEHSELIADSSEVDVVLVSEGSARRNFPRWPWIPMDDSESANALVGTWAVWSDPDSPDLRSCLAAMREVSGASVL